ncbi:MAG TPA: TIGR03790 family protein, partial [Gemmataceae bacterium]|nr:TIGR03790 family protein [Gemmataceae bacterium]
MRWLLAVAASLAGLIGPAGALGPQDIVILYNKNLPSSKSVADYYAQRRGVPAGNFIPLDLPDVDEISRADYESRILNPVRAALKDRRPMPRVLLTVYGIPLRIGEQQLSDADKASLEKLKPELESSMLEVRKLTLSVRMLKADVEKDPKSPLAQTLTEREGQLAEAQRKVRGLEEVHGQLNHRESTAAVDSELMLMWWRPYNLSRWMVNPLYWQVPAERRHFSQPVMMTCRLDAQTPAIAKRLVDDAIAAEQRGLSGKAYIDARGIQWDKKVDPAGTGYGGYDESFREAARLLEGPAKMDVTLENTENLFA